MLKGLFNNNAAQDEASLQRISTESIVDPSRIPYHIAIIMDGNGRWAKNRGLPRVMGHRHGIESLRDVTKACGELGVKILTVYAFSTENWDRPREEVNFLLQLLDEVLETELETLHSNQVRVNVIGRRDGFPKSLADKIAAGEDLTRNNKGLILNVCFNYGGRAEIVDAVNRVLQMARNGELGPDEIITEDRFSQLIYTSGFPDPDLLIRTGGDSRISNFLLWQLAYTEIWLTTVCWPDFRRAHLIQAIADFQRRERRFGKV